MGLMLAEPGFHTRCYVEWEEYPRRALIAGQRAGYLGAGPIWDDLTTFDARPFRGAFDTVLAGYPCQPFSQAGQRKGEDDERHLWPDVARIIREIDPEWVFLENVAGHVTLGGEAVLRELRQMGYTPAVGLFSAEEVSASHERLRWFCVANADGRDASPEREQCGGEQRLHPEGGRAGSPLGHTQGIGRGEGWAEPEFRVGRDTPSGADRTMADASGAELEGQFGRQRDAGGRQEPDGHPALSGRAGLFPPGPADMEQWAGVLRVAPHLAPSLSLGDVKRAADHFAQMVARGELAETQAKSIVRLCADGMANRSRALRLLGNGVVPLAAAHAWRTLSAAHGLRTVDLGATAGKSTSLSADADLRAAE